MPAIIPAFAGVTEAIRDLGENTGLEEISANNFLPTMSFHFLTWDIEGELVSLEVSSILARGNVPLVPWWGNDSMELMALEFKVARVTYSISHLNSSQCGEL